MTGPVYDDISALFWILVIWKLFFTLAEVFFKVTFFSTFFLENNFLENNEIWNGKFQILKKIKTNEN